MSISRDQQQFHDTHAGPNVRLAIRILKVRRLWIISSMLCAASLGILKHFSEKSSFVSTATLAVDSQEQKQIFGPVPGLLNADNFMPKIHALISQFQQPEACAELKSRLMEQNFIVPSGEDVCSSLQFQADQDKLQVGIFSRTGSPELSRMVASAAADIFIKFDQIKLRRKVSELKAFLAGQEAELEAKLKKIETDKAEFQAKSSVLSIEHAERFISDRLERAEQDFLDTQLLLKSNERMLEQTRKSIEELKGATESGSPVSSLYLSQVQYRLNMLQYQKSALQTKKDNEGLKKIDGEISQLMKVYQGAIAGAGAPGVPVGGDPIDYMTSLRQSERTLLKDREVLNAKGAALEKNVSKKGDDLKNLVGTMRQLAEMTRERDISNGLYSVVRKRLQEIEIDEAGAVSDFVLLAPASSGYPENIPFAKKLLFALGIGFFVAVAIIAVSESIASTIRSHTDLERMGLNFMGYIPKVTAIPKGQLPLLLTEHPETLEADAIRGLRFKLQGFHERVAPPNYAMVVLLTSPHSETGKSFVSVNLADAFSRAGQRTLLIDLDLRHTSIKKAFPESSAKGRLLEASETKPLESLIEKVRDNLDILFPEKRIDGAPEFIEKMFLGQTLDPLKNDYNVILIDSPPVLSVIDLHLIMGVVDLQLLIVEHRKTHREDVHHAVAQLQKMRELPLVVVVNRAEPEIVFMDQGKYYKVVQANHRKVS